MKHNEMCLKCWAGLFRSGSRASRGGVRDAEELVTDPATLAQTAEEGAVHCGRVVADCMLPYTHTKPSVSNA